MMPDSSAQPFLDLQKQRSPRTWSVLAAFMLAWAAGTTAGGGPFAVYLASAAIMSGEGGMAGLAIVPIVFAAIASLAGMLIVALPATVFLRSCGAETRRAYCIIGALGGAVLAMVITFAFFGPVPTDDIPWQPLAVLGAAGAVAGLAASFVWGGHRMRMLACKSAAQPAAPNPIHELLH